MKINVMKLIENTKVNPRYDLPLSSCVTLIKQSNGTFALMSNSFKTGYAQGIKAARKELSAEVSA